MEIKKDFYKVLGITDEEKKLKGEEFNKIAQQKFRKLSLQYHPDKFAAKSETERKNAEEKFKEINEAYQTLTNKRDEYDNPNPFGGGTADASGFDFSDIFGSFFGGGRPHQKVKKGANLKINLNVNLNDLYEPITKKIKYTINDGTNGKVCPHCGGTGTLFSTRGNTQILTTCPYCGGKGIETTKKEVETEFTINGIDDEYDVQYNEQINTLSFVKVVKHAGHTISSNKSENGDLYVNINVRLPYGYKPTSPTDVAFDVQVPVISAIIGGEIEVKSLNGTTLKTNVPQGIGNGERIKFKGKGLPKNGKCGDLFGIVKIKMPKKINNTEKELLSQLQTSENFK